MQKACEFLIKDLALRSWRHTEQNRRRTVQRTDVHAAVGESEMFDFLIDLVPRVSPPNVPPARATTSVTSAAVPAAAPPQAAAAAVGVSTEQQSQDTATAPSDAETRYAQLQEMQNQMHEHYTMMQQRAQAEQIPALPGMMTTTAAATTTHAPAPVVEGQTLQPQVVLNPQLVIHPPQGAAMPQWQPASNGATAEDEATNDPLTHHAASEL
jgi:NADH dehydrogenase/NADH:ubiquinone oxidoreductase subunit G